MRYELMQQGVLSQSVLGIGFVLISASTAHGQMQGDTSKTSASQSSAVVTAAFPRPLMNAKDDRYPIVDYCASQVTRLIDSALWGHRVDTIEWNTADTLPTVVRTRAHQCMTRFDLRTVGRLSLPVAVNISLAARDDSAVYRVIDSLIIAQRDGRIEHDRGAQQANELLKGLLYAAPARLDLARAAIARSEMLNGPRYAKGKGERLILNSRIELYEILFGFGRQTFDTMIMKESHDSVRKMIDAFRAERTPLSSVNDSEVHLDVTEELRVLSMEVYLKAIRFGSDSAVKIYRDVIALRGTLSPNLRVAPDDLLIGSQAPTIDVPFHFFRNGIDRFPMPGRTMVVLTIRETCEALCATAVRRLQSKIGNIPIVIVSELFGNVRQSPPGTPAQNAEALRAHLQDSLKLNMSLVMDTVPRYVTPAPDSRYLYSASRLTLRWEALMRSSSRFMESPQRLEFGDVAVVDKHSRVVWVDNLAVSGNQSNKFLVAMINSIAKEK